MCNWPNHWFPLNENDRLPEGIGPRMKNGEILPDRRPPEEQVFEHLMRPAAPPLPFQGETRRVADD